MFTGIVEDVGEVRSVEDRGGDRTVMIAPRTFAAAELGLGDSVSVRGCCLTVVAVVDDAFRADLSGETLARTLFAALAAGSRVNLERAMLPTTRMGGHMVTGHVDGVGTLVRCEPEARSVIMEFAVPATLSRFMAEKGSVCVDGVSLTVNRVESERFIVNLVPHTLEVTTLGFLSEGDPVHLEADLIARYVDRLLSMRSAAT